MAIEINFQDIKELLNEGFRQDIACKLCEASQPVGTLELNTVGQASLNIAINCHGCGEDIGEIWTVRLEDLPFSEA